jgi:cytoskeletal protein CcmA (bactofilin family)
MPTGTSQHFAPSTSKICEELLITGNVTSKGELHIDGTVQGEILCHSLTIGDKSQIEGSVVAEEVVIRGRLVGSVHASKVTLHSRCHVEGEVSIGDSPSSRARFSMVSRVHGTKVKIESERTSRGG